MFNSITEQRCNHRRGTIMEAVRPVAIATAAANETDAFVLTLNYSMMALRDSGNTLIC